MRIKPIHPAFIMPTKGTEQAGAFDIYMPEAGSVCGSPVKIPLGFATAIPDGHVALLLPRSSSGGKSGLELNNTCGVIDSDYRGEWQAIMKTKSGIEFKWEAGDRILQFLVIPVANITLERVVVELDPTERGTGGFGSSGT